MTHNYPFLDALLRSYPGSTWDYKAEWGWERYQVSGKMFAATCLPGPEHHAYAGHPLLTLKCDPLHAQALRPISSPAFTWIKQTGFPSFWMAACPKPCCATCARRATNWFSVS